MITIMTKAEFKAKKKAAMDLWKNSEFYGDNLIIWRTYEEYALKMVEVIKAETDKP